MKNIQPILVALLVIRALSYAQTPLPSPNNGGAGGGGGGGGGTGNVTGASSSLKGSNPCFSDATGVALGNCGSTINIKSYGAICDGAHQSADSTAFLAAIAAATAGQGVEIPIGTCQLDNSAGVVTVTGYNGTIFGQGPKSILAFSTITQNGLLVTGSASNLTIRDLAFTYTTTASARGTLQGILNVESSTNVLLRNLSFSNAPDSGLEMAQDQHSRVEGITCSNLYANCIFTVNMVDLTVNSVHSSTSRDYAVEASYYSGNTLNTCRTISISDINSFQDVGTVLINGCSDVTVTNVASDSSTYSPIFIQQTNSTMPTEKHYPDNLTFSNMSITNVGSGPTVANFPQAQASGIAFAVDTNPAAVLHVNLSNVRIFNTKAYGVQMLNTGFNEWSVNASNVIVDGTGSGTSGDGGWLANGFEVNCTGCQVSRAGGSSINLQNGVNAFWSNFTSVNPNVGFSGSDNAILSTTTGTVIFDGINLFDTGTTPVSRINQAGASGTQLYRNIQTIMPNGGWQGFTNANSAGARASTGGTTNGTVFWVAGASNCAFLVQAAANTGNFSGGSAGGSGLCLNAPGGFTGNFQDFKVNNGSSVFSVNYQGNVTANNFTSSTGALSSVSAAAPYLLVAGSSLIPKGMYAAVTPDALSPAWLNQGGASEATVNKARVLTAPQTNGVNVRLRTVTMTAGTSLTAAFSAQLINVYGQVTRCGVGMINGTSDFGGFWLTSDSTSTNTLALGHYSGTGGTWTSDRAAGITVSTADVIYVRFTYISSGTYNFQISFDGVNFTSVNTSFFQLGAAPSAWFYGCDNNQSGATVGNIFLTLLSFSAA